MLYILFFIFLKENNKENFTKFPESFQKQFVVF